MKNICPEFLSLPLLFLSILFPLFSFAEHKGVGEKIRSALPPAWEVEWDFEDGKLPYNVRYLTDRREVAGIWSIVNDGKDNRALRINSSGESGSKTGCRESGILFGLGKRYRNAIIELDMKLIDLGNPDARAGLMFHRAPERMESLNGIQVLGGDLGGAKIGWLLRERDGKSLPFSREWLTGRDGNGIKAGQWYHLRVECIERNCRVFVNRRLLFQGAFPHGRSSGTVGLHSFNADVLFDNVKFAPEVPVYQNSLSSVPSDRGEKQEIQEAAIPGDQWVQPIRWDLLRRASLEMKGKAGQELAGAIRSINKYIVNTWWQEGHFFSNQNNPEQPLRLRYRINTECTIRGIAHQARTLATSLQLGLYDSAITGIPEEKARRMAFRLIAMLGREHCANKAKGWGARTPLDHWQSAYWAADVAWAAWALWKDLDGETRSQILKMIEHEANRFADYKVPYWRNRSGRDVYPGDSKCEENGWNSVMLMTAAAMLPKHKNRGTWLRKGAELAISAYSTPSDLTSQRSVNGLKVGSLLQGYNMLENGMVYNHWRVHPDYLACVALVAINATAWAVTGEPYPEFCTFNVGRVYEAFVNYDLGGMFPKFKGQHLYVRDTQGRATSKMVFPMGNDWGSSRVPVPYLALDALAYALGLDTRCEVKAEEWLAVRSEDVVLRQKRGYGGDLSKISGAFYRKSDSDIYPLREEWVSHHLIATYLTLLCREAGVFHCSKQPL